MIVVVVVTARCQERVFPELSSYLISLVSCIIVYSTYLIHISLVGSLRMQPGSQKNCHGTPKALGSIDLTHTTLPVVTYIPAYEYILHILYNILVVCLPAY
jgi:hypothetical protein